MSETTSSSDPSGSGSSAAPQIDWPGLIGEWSKFTQEVVDRFSKRAAANADSARQGLYSRQHWLDDVEWFWHNLGDDAARGVQICRDKFTSS